MTGSGGSRYQEELSAWVIDQQLHVSYRWLAHVLAVDVDAAKRCAAVDSCCCIEGLLGRVMWCGTLCIGLYCVLIVLVLWLCAVQNAV